MNKQAENAQRDDVISSGCGWFFKSNGVSNENGHENALSTLSSGFQFIMIIKRAHFRFMAVTNSYSIETYMK